jgi:hypothetical protein
MNKTKMKKYMLVSPFVSEGPAMNMFDIKLKKRCMFQGCLSYYQMGSSRYPYDEYYRFAQIRKIREFGEPLSKEYEEEFEPVFI